MLPRPSANLTEYNQIRDRGFERYPRRRENYEKYLLMCKHGYTSDIPIMPIKIDYEASSLCNFRCQMCLLSGPTPPPRTQMKYEDFKQSLDEQYGLIEVKLQGLGEPLLNKDFLKMVHEAVNRDIWVRTTTNGSLLDRDENYKRLIDEKIGEIQISIDGATKNTFEKIRHGSDFNLVVENVKRLNEYAWTKNEAWRTSCWMLVQRDNFNEVEKLLDLAEYMRFTRVVYSLNVSDWGEAGDWTEVNGKINMRNNFSEDMGYRLIEIGKEKGISVSFWDGSDKYVYDSQKDKICQWLFSRAFISGDMRIVPCCTICDPKMADMGNALEFETVWKGPKYNSLREAHLKGQIPKMCRMCYSSTEQ